jgi:hypothetical protein
MSVGLDFTRRWYTGCRLFRDVGSYLGMQEELADRMSIEIGSVLGCKFG